MAHSRTLLDHTIVGGSALTNFTFDKNREYAGCRICGDIFQPSAKMRHWVQLAQIAEWREKHNRTHSAAEHMALAESGLTLTPEAALKMAPFGLVPVADALAVDEIDAALREAPRAPTDDVETSLRGYRGGS